MQNIIAKDNTPLGANYNEATQCVDFKLFSKNADVVKLLIFDEPQNADAVMILNMKKEGDIFSTSIKDYILNCKEKPVYYGFRVFGDNWVYNEKFVPGGEIGFISKFDKNGNRFNPNKLAYDPYTKELSHLPTDVNPGGTMFRSGAKFHLTDSAKLAPKSVYFKNKDFEIPKVAPRPFLSEIIGEVHIKDLTQNLPMKEKGTFLGAKNFASNLKELGITMVEFLPLNEFDSKQAGGNYWGYMPLGYFSLKRSYAYDKSYGNLLNEFRQMTAEFHKNDIKVCLDMVYNHTGEAGLINHDPNDATLLSYALIDNASYYKNFENGYYRSNSGCGNDFNPSNKEVLDLIVDSLVFWVNQGVDAFRFDLAAALLECSESCEEIYNSMDSAAARLKDKLKERGVNVVEDFTKADDGIILIAEPWTCGGKCCYQLGNFPSFWAEWNDISRDTIRKLTLRPDEITPNQIRNVFEGTPSVFKGNEKSINYIASHDGFTLFDLNNFTRKSSSTSGGSDWEISGDYSGDNVLREKAIRKQLIFLFLSFGTPMIQIADIIMHTKNGNNNSYNKDDATNYINWQKAVHKDGIEKRMLTYTTNLIRFLKDNPIFKSKYFLSKVTYHYDNADIADDKNMGYWTNHDDIFFGALVNTDKKIYIASNKGGANINMTLPKTDKNWKIIMDTSNLDCLDFKEKEQINSNYSLEPNSAAIFVEGN